MNRIVELEISDLLYHTIENKLNESYGTNPHEYIKERLEEEWHATERTKSIIDIAFLYELTLFLKEHNYPWRIRGCAGSSLILYLLGITRGNPLPAHLYCPECHLVLWQNCLDGFDCKREVCGIDQGEMIADGHDIPWQSLWGYGDYEPSFDIDLPEILFESIEAILTMNRFACYNLNIKTDVPYSDKVKMIKVGKITMIFSLENDSVDKNFYIPSFTDINVVKLLQRWNELVGDNAWEQYNPLKTFSELYGLYGLIHSTTTYIFDKSELCYTNLICDRECVFSYLIKHGFLEKDAWMGMHSVQMGHLLPVITDEMKNADDRWIIEQCKYIKYLFPKAHAIEWILYKAKML